MFDKQIQLNRNWAFRLVYDDAEGETNVEGSPEGENKEIKTVETNKNVTKTYTQEDLNKFLAEDRKKNQQNRDKLIKDLDTLRNTANLTTQEKDDLSARIEQLQNETLTAKELAKKDHEALTKTHLKETTKLQSERDFWKDKYTKEKIEREIIDAAIENEALSPQQIMKLVKPDTKLVEELNSEGKSTGEWIPKVNFAMTNESDGSVKLLELNVKEAIKRMKELKEHGNLFKSGATGGLGGYNFQPGNGFKGKTPPTDPVQYQKWRAENLSKSKR